MNNVRTVLTAKQWNALRGMVADQAWNVCEICGGEGPNHPVECHEIWEYNDVSHIQRLVGMIALCPDCHMVKHFGFARVRGKEELAFKHFMKVNSLKKKDAEREITNAFDTWRKRSLIDWKLDLSGLKKYGIDPSKINQPLMTPGETE
jgi:NapC/NirT cytochrome c family, N-terminal region